MRKWHLHEALPLSSSFNERSRTRYFPPSARKQTCPHTNTRFSQGRPTLARGSRLSVTAGTVFNSQATSLSSSKRANECLFLRNRGRGKALVEDEDSTDGMEAAETGSRQETGNCSPIFLACFPTLFFSPPPHIPCLNVFSQRSGFPVSVFSFQPSHPPSSRVRERGCLSSEAVPMINKITMWSPELIFFPSCAVNLTQTSAGRGGAFERLGRPHSLSRIDEIFARLHMAPLSSSNWKDLTPATAFLLWSRPSTSQSMGFEVCSSRWKLMPAESLLKSHLVHFPLIFSALCLLVVVHSLLTAWCTFRFTSRLITCFGCSCVYAIYL